MKVLKSTQGLLLIAVAGLLLTSGMPVSANADPQGHGRNGDNNQRNGKCGKFVNCHDARDGRVDGKGPQRRADSRWDNNRHNRTYNRSGYRNSLNQARLDRLRRQHALENRRSWRDNQRYTNRASNRRWRNR